MGMAAKALRKGSTKTFTENALGIPTDRSMKVIAYDDDRVTFEWETETEVFGQGTQPVVRVASCTRKEWDK